MDSFECTKCSKSYKYRTTLFAHQRMHNGTAYACEFCDKRFYQKVALERHRIAHTLERPFACDVDGCGKKFGQKSVLQGHTRTVHEKVQQYVCEQCDRRFGTKSNLTAHRKLHTFSEPYICDVDGCEKRFTMKGNMSRHKLVVHEKVRKYRCDHCDKSFGSSTDLKKHNRQHTGERQFACDKCDQRFRTKHGAQQHWVAHTVSKPFICDVDGCETSFKGKSNVLKHKRVVHEKVRKYRCEHCDKSFGSSTDLKKHNRQHTGEQPYACTDCVMKFSQKDNLQEHYRRKHTDERLFACDKCDQRFGSKYEARQHHVVHTLSKPFMCDVDGCETSFTVKNSMLTHKRVVHEKVRKHRCEQCDNSFGSLADLKRHNRVHTGERPYACTECAMKFKVMTKLRDHYRRTHTLERPYACGVDACENMFATIDDALRHKRRVHEKVPSKYRCEQCEYVPTYSDNLRRHRRTHTGERPFACTDCEKKFAERSNLQHHFYTKHTLERPFACAQCQKTFATVQARTRHTNKAHKM